MFFQTPAKTVTVILVALGLALYAGFGGFFAREIVIEIAILAILAISLDMVAGFGAMISLCHGALFGLGAYGYAIATAMLGLPTAVGALAGVALAAAFGLFVAAVTSHTTGIFTIMATLAFGQMAYAVIFQAKSLGGDDGMPGVPRFDASAIGVDLGDSMLFALLAVLVMAAAYAAAAAVLRSAFGRALSGIHSNEARMRAIGVSTWRRKTQAFGISAAIAGVAGVLAAQHTQFVSPDLLFWTVSGEILIVVILGGLGTLAGPVLGAALLVLLKHEVSAFTNHWHIVIGAALILAVLAGGRGVFGEIEHRLSRRSARGAADA